MAEISPFSPEMGGIPMFRNESNDSQESTDSPFGSALNTPADERFLHFDSKLLSAGATVLEHLEDRGRSPRRVSLSRQFSKALNEANRSTSKGVLFRARSASVGLMYPEEHVPSVPHPSPNLLSFASPELPSHPIEHPQRVQTPEPPISTAYNPGSPQFIARTTPQNRPPLRRNIFSSESKPIPFGVEDEPISGDDFTPRAYSTIRQRKGTFTLLNDSITGQPALDMLEAVDVHTADTHDTHDAHDVTLDESSTDREDNFALNGPTLPPLSPFFALQMLLFPAYCVLVGAAIILFPVHLNTIAFPASANRPNSPTLRARLVSLAQPVIAHCLPFAAPPSAIRAFAHWATVAHLHVAIFLAALVGTAYLSLPLGVLLAAACAGQFVRAWGDFALEDGTELGGDVRQMLYQVLVAPECGFGDRDALKRVGGQYYLVRAPPTETRSEILAAAGVEDDSGSDEDLE